MSVSLQLILKTIAPFWPFIISGLSEADISMFIMFGLSSSFSCSFSSFSSSFSDSYSISYSIASSSWISWKSFSVESLFGVPNNFKQLARVNNIAKNTKTLNGLVIKLKFILEAGFYIEDFWIKNLLNNNLFLK